MSYQVLSRKWRPKKFQDVIGQEHITTSLVNALKRGRTGHAYLFTGTRGVGKTSVARIFAKSIRCQGLSPEGQYCGECVSCKTFGDTQTLDVIEIDGASNNSVDNIRELINNVQFLPSVGKYRVYIIDEVHMLSTSAFNALLKTLEEPPEHVIFIFATTEPEKILDTVLSRCQRFDFRSPSMDKLSKLIMHIAEKEAIKFENQNIVEKISFFGNGSVRDSLSILDQLLTFSEDNYIDENTLFLGLGLAKQTSLYELTEAILNGDAVRMTEIYRGLQSENVSSEKIYHGLIDTIYELIDSLMGGKTQYKKSLDNFGPQELMWIYETLSKDLDWATKTFDLGKTLEIIIHKVCIRREQYGEVKIQKKKIVKAVVAETTPKEIDPVEIIPAEEMPVLEATPEPIPAPIEPVIKIDQNPNWEGFLKHIHELSPVTGHNLDQGNITSEPTLSENVVTVNLGFPKSAKVFYEYLSQIEVRNKLIGMLSNYYQVTEVNLEFDLKVKEENFHSVANLKDIKYEEALKEKEQNMLDNPSLKMAESLFNAKVDKVVVNKKQ